MFGSNWPKIFGTYGTFSLDHEGKSLPVKYLLTKMKPGKDGTWECEFASQLAPWREIFDVEELTFDELVQRDLDDSRVAHDLIPYILDDNDESARFFPPILAVLAPSNSSNKGISDYYPPISGSGNNIDSEGLYKFNSISIDGNESPLGAIEYNRQRSKFVIVDGQHRAMAILALHRQLNNEWGDNSFQAYYDHLEVNESDLKNIELPVCVLFMPELTENNKKFVDKQITLNTVCREIFLAVNKNAKKVSKAREILLDDEDLAARMMRRTLTSLKDRSDESNSLSRVYSFSYGDDDGDAKQVLSGKFEYSSAVFLHKLHLANIFANSEAFRFDKKIDITDGRRLKNSDRASELLLGTSLENYDKVSRLSGKQYTHSDVQELVSKLGSLTDSILLNLYDGFIPYKIQNMELRKLRSKLSDSNSKSDLVQSKCYSLLFEGSGAKTVFEAHRDRLSKIKESEKKLPDNLENQMEFISSIETALYTHEEDYKISRAFSLFNYDPVRLKNNETYDQDRKKLLSKARTIFDTVNTQAFQLGFLMSVQSILEMLLEHETEYGKRSNYITQITTLFVSVLNNYFSDSSENKRIKFGVGFYSEPRANVFSTKELGLRRLLSISGVQELNEKQWHFFRYAILEIVFSKYNENYFDDKLNDTLSPELRDDLERNFDEIKVQVEKYRDDLIEKAVDSALRSADFSDKLEVALFGCSSLEERENITKELEDACRRETIEHAQRCYTASLFNKN